MSNIQPLTPYEPTTSVLLANRAAPLTPKTPTNVSLVSTVPPQSISTFSAVRQLPSNVLTTIASQQAVNNSNLSTNEKINQGVIDGVGATFQQLSMPGQAMKPGAGKFAQSLRQRTPGLPLDKLATPVLMTGSNGVNNANNLVRNNAAQLGAIASSVKTATTNLTNNGTLTGKEGPTQVGGVILAASLFGSAAVTAALKNPSTVASTVGGIGNALGNAITSGNFAAGMADKALSGMSGLATSLSGLAKSAAGTIGGGIASIAAGAGGLLQKAFNIAEKSFGSMKANKPNVLGGLPELEDLPLSATANTMRQNEVVRAELEAAETDLQTARSLYALNDSEYNYGLLRSAEETYASATRKAAQYANKIISGAAPTQSGNIAGGISTQTLTTAAAAAASGLLTSPSTSNSGVNAVPGGLGAFASQISGAATSVVSSIKNVVLGTASLVPGAISKLSNPTELVGNLVNNLKQTVSNISGNLSQGINNISNAIGTTIDNARTAVNSIVGGAASAATGLVANVTSALSSLGNSPGQVKAAVLATDTYAATKTVMNATLNSMLDPKVPPPIFDDAVVVAKVNTQQEAQVKAQIAIENLIAERELKSYKLSSLTTTYYENQQANLIPVMDGLRDEIDALDIKIIAAQQNYNRIVKG